MEWQERDGTRWLEADLGGGARAAFSTRLGGVSEGDFESLNLGVLTDDETSRVVENRRRLAAALGIDPERIAFSRQVHGAEVMRRDGSAEGSTWTRPGGEPPEADGHLTAEAGLALLVFVADCVPIALAGPGGVGMLHGGWRGLAAGIVGRGAEGVGATSAAIGPAIGPCCYEVGEEVLRAFTPLGDGLADGRMLDLPAVARRLLERAGVGEVQEAGLCTRCNPDLFFSHRGSGGRTGRQAGLAWKEAG
jgi:polyphenol oxidase